MVATNIDAEDAVNCKKCKLKITKQCNAIQCDKCDSWFHIKCINILETKFKKIRDLGSISIWLCDDDREEFNKWKNNSNNAEQNLFDESKILNAINDINKRLKTIEDKVDNNVNQISKPSFANVLNSSIEGYRSVIATNKSEQFVVVKPKKNQNSDTTRAELARKIPNPESVSAVHKIPKGGLVINCKNIEESKKLQKEASTKLGEDYTVIIPELKNPKMKILDMCENLSEDDIIKYIKKQNTYLSDGYIKVLDIYENNLNKQFNAIIEVDTTTFQKINEQKKIIIGWNVCRVYEYIHIKRCYKCCGFNHKSSVCKNKQACLKCGGEHIKKNCTSMESECVNCKSINEKLNLKFDTNHPAYSRECPVYKRKIENVQKNIKYNQ